MSKNKQARFKITNQRSYEASGTNGIIISLASPFVVL